MKKIIDFLFFRWEQTIEERGSETWIDYLRGNKFKKNYVIYRWKHKYVNREYLEKVYLEN
jgi:hypothetical protein